MNILFAPDSFKGSMSSLQVIHLLETAFQKHFPGSQMRGIPVGDGGEGTVDALVQALGGTYESCQVCGPLGAPVTASYGVIHGRIAVIEMAQASGLALLSPSELDPMCATSYGTGQLIRQALERGYQEIYLMLGGSATNDGGMGAAAALGFQFFDKSGNSLSPCGKNLSLVASIDASYVIKSLFSAKILLMCDVSNPLLGPNGATYVYGPQKGATAETLPILEAGMVNYAHIIEAASGRQLCHLPGSGAAGGLALPLLGFAQVTQQSGIETVLSLLDFDHLLEGVDLVITGEGCLDGQSVQGKVLAGIGSACRRKGVPAVAIVGSRGEGASKIHEFGILAHIACIDRVISQDTALQNAEESFLRAADQMFRLIKVGMIIH